MKKTIFDLKFEEGKKLDKELHKTSYFKQYTRGYIFSLLVLIFMGFGVITSLAPEEATSSTYLIVPIMIMVGFGSLFTLLFWFKRFDLIKDYYEKK